MNSIVTSAVEKCKRAGSFYLKFIAANDTKATSNHQYGYHIHKEAWTYFLQKPGVKGENIDVPITIKWQDDFETSSHFKYYGKETRNEYRITQFQKGFPFREEHNIGDLLILCKVDKDYYLAYVLSTDDDIEYFLTSFGLATSEVNAVVGSGLSFGSEKFNINEFDSFIKKTIVDFPTSLEMALEAKKISEELNIVTSKFLLQNPDAALLAWLDIEYKLFRAFEKVRYNEKLNKGFISVDELINFSNTILNRRKSRAGKSLEHHLASIFDAGNIQYERQARTERKRKPDFIFPNGKAYHDSSFLVNKLFFLGAKTTCKDRWSQILNEADRIKVKHLMTLQQGISSSQLTEMKKNNVVLVVPAEYKDSFPQKQRHNILSLREFLIKVQLTQNKRN